MKEIILESEKKLFEKINEVFNINFKSLNKMIYGLYFDNKINFNRFDEFVYNTLNTNMDYFFKNQINYYNEIIESEIKNDIKLDELFDLNRRICNKLIGDYEVCINNALNEINKQIRNVVNEDMLYYVNSLIKKNLYDQFNEIQGFINSQIKTMSNKIEEKKDESKKDNEFNVNMEYFEKLNTIPFNSLNDLLYGLKDKIKFELNDEFREKSVSPLLEEIDVLFNNINDNNFNLEIIKYNISIIRNKLKNYYSESAVNALTGKLNAIEAVFMSKASNFKDEKASSSRALFEDFEDKKNDNKNLFDGDFEDKKYQTLKEIVNNSSSLVDATTKEKEDLRGMFL